MATVSRSETEPSAEGIQRSENERTNMIYSNISAVLSSFSSNEPSMEESIVEQTERRADLDTIMNTINTDQVNDDREILALGFGHLVSLLSERMTKRMNIYSKIKNNDNVKKSINKKNIFGGAPNIDTVDGMQPGCSKSIVDGPTATAIIKTEPLDFDAEITSFGMNSESRVNLINPITRNNIRPTETLASLLNSQFPLYVSSPTEIQQKLTTRPAIISRPVIDRKKIKPTVFNSSTLPHEKKPLPTVVRVVAKRNQCGQVIPSRVVAVRRPTTQYTVKSTSPTFKVPNATVSNDGPPQKVTKICPPFLHQTDLSHRLSINPMTCYGVRKFAQITESSSMKDTCNHCGRILDEGMIDEHMRRDHPRIWNKCSVYTCILRECDYESNTRNEMKDHCESLHTKEYDIWDQNGRFNLDEGTLCPLCSASIPIISLKSLRMHIRTSHKEEWPTIICSSCSSTFSSTYHILDHWRQSPSCTGRAQLFNPRNLIVN